MPALTDDIRRESERGVILLILVKKGLDWIPVGELRQQLARGQGYFLTDDELRFHLKYLGDATRGYVELRGLRPGRMDPSLTLVRATAKALDLVDGRIEPDPGVAL